LVQVDLDHVVVKVLVGDIGKEVRRFAFEFFEEDAFGGNATENLTVGRTRDGDSDRA
jgi:hypothetical protein